jgi:hypothetical protein
MVVFSSDAERPKSFVHVMMAMRSSTPDIVDITQLPSNAIMMNRKMLCDMFGETFAARGSLIIDHCANMNAPVAPTKTKKVGAIESSADSSKLQL